MASLDEIRNERIKKLELLRSKGINPYPGVSRADYTLKDVREMFEELSGKKEGVYLAGRVMLLRKQGGLVFFQIDDGTGRFQGLIKRDEVLEEIFSLFTETVDMGDFLEIEGTLFATQKGEKTLLVKSWRMLTKSLRALPDKWGGLEDVEERFRRRYLDMIANSDMRDLFVKKSRFWQCIREFLTKEGGLEVETPVLEHIPGGADAEPFTTHLNTLDTDLYLRISLELNLKRLLVGGFPKVFEIGRIFRNEGIDREHLQDYTQMEMYWAYHDFKKLMGLLEKMYREVIMETVGSLTHEYQGQTIDWSPPWPSVDYYEVFKEHTGRELKGIREEDLRRYAKEEGIETEKHIGAGRLIDAIFKKKVRPHLIKPCFLVLPPAAVEPLAKRFPNDPDRVERFQIVAGGSELGKGFSELNDPLDQRKRFEEQMRLREAGDKEAQMIDEDFIEALEYGMPPSAGFGVSERLFAFLMDRPVRETVFFPLMKPRG